MTLRIISPDLFWRTLYSISCIAPHLHHLLFTSLALRFCGTKDSSTLNRLLHTGHTYDIVLYSKSILPSIDQLTDDILEEFISSRSLSKEPHEQIYQVAEDSFQSLLGLHSELPSVSLAVEPLPSVHWPSAWSVHSYQIL